MFGKKKKRQKKIKRGAIPYVFLVMGFFGAALTEEVINIMHENAKSIGPVWYGVYQYVVIVAWIGVIVSIVKMIEKSFEEK